MPRVSRACSTPSRSRFSARTPWLTAVVRQRSSQQSAGLVRRGHLDAGLVEQQVEQGELGEELAVEHRLEVELDVGLAGEGGGVAQQPQDPAVGQDRPQVLVGAVEQLLHHRVRGAPAAPATPGLRRSSGTPQPSRWMGVRPTGG